MSWHRQEEPDSWRSSCADQSVNITRGDLMRIRTTLSICFASLTLSGFAFAKVTECEENSDCGENGVCQKDMWTTGCGPSEDGNTDHCSSETMTAETGYCYTSPPTCDTDAECGEYLQCVQVNGAVCWADSDGNSGCTEPDPVAPSYCSQSTLICEDDSECPREFECVDAPGGCLDIVCPDEDPGCGCYESAHKECQPRAIECEDDSACPEAWMCLGGIADCGDSRSGSGLDVEVSDSSDSEAPECAADLKGQCYPVEWTSPGTAGGDLISGDASGEDASAKGSPGTESNGESGEASSGGGCSVNRVPSSRSWLLGLLALPFLALRRRRSMSA
jgi:MYXO-CTERM domain-containing protein